MNVFSLFATLSLDATEYERNLKAAENKLNNVERNFTNAGRTLTLGLTAPILGVGTAALKSSIDFESAFAGVRKTVDATEAEFAMLEAGIRDMSQRLPASANEIAAVAEAAGQLGIAVPNILDFTEVMIGLGESSNMSATEAATSLARFANIMQMPQDQVSNLASTIVELGNNLATTEGEITELGLRLAGTGNLVGLSEAEIMGLAGAMSSVGIRAEAGGTAMSRVMQTIMTAVMAGGEELQGFATVAGVAADEFAQKFRTSPIEAVMLFSQGLARVDEEGGNTIAVLEDLSISEARASDTLLRLAGSGDVLADSIGMATSAWEENTALQEEVGRRYETTESQLSMLWNSLTEVTRTLGDALIPFLLSAIEAAKPFIAALQSLAEWFGDLDPRMQTVIISITGIVAAIGPVLLVFGSFAGSIANLIPLLGMIPGAAGAIGAAFTLLTGPVGAVIAIVTALVAVFATDFLGIRTAVVNAWHAIVDAFRAAGEHMRTALRNAKEAITDWWEDVKATLGGIPAQMLQFGKDMITGLVNGLKSMVGNAVDTVKNVGDSIVTGFKNLLGIESPSKVFHQFGLDIGQGLADGITESQSTVLAAVGGLGKAMIKGGAYDADNVIQGLIQGLDLQQARKVLQEAYDASTDTWRRLPSIGNMHGQRTYLEGMVGMHRNALSDALEENSRAIQTMNHKLDDLSRREEAHVRRFSFSIDAFSNDVRGLTLAKQRY